MDLKDWFGAHIHSIAAAVERFRLQLPWLLSGHQRILNCLFLCSHYRDRILSFEVLALQMNGFRSLNVLDLSLDEANKAAALLAIFLALVLRGNDLKIYAWLRTTSRYLWRWKVDRAELWHRYLSTALVRAYARQTLAERIWSPFFVAAGW